MSLARADRSRWRAALTAATPIAVLGTLVCCALPIAMVAIGAGSVVAAAVTALPWLPALSQSKEWVFSITGLILAANYWALFRSGAACRPGGICHRTHPVGKLLRRVFFASATAYGLALLAAYAALPFTRWLGY